MDSPLPIEAFPNYGVFEIFDFNFNLRTTFLISSAKRTIPEKHVKKYLPE